MKCIVHGCTSTFGWATDNEDICIPCYKRLQDAENHTVINDWRDIPLPSDEEIWKAKETTK